MSIAAFYKKMFAGTPFRNVKGSTDDPKIDGQDWLDLWESTTGESGCVKCCACSKKWAQVGGHVVLGEGKEGDAAADGNILWEAPENRVFIVPLCKNCNGQSSSIVFRAEYDIGIAWLCAYGRDKRYPEQEIVFKYEDDKKFYREVKRYTTAYEQENARLIDSMKLEERDREILEADYGAFREKESGNSRESERSGVSLPATPSTWSHASGRSRASWRSVGSRRSAGSGASRGYGSTQRGDFVYYPDNEESEFVWQSDAENLDWEEN